MQRVHRLAAAATFVVAGAAAIGSSAFAAPPAPQPVTIPCATNISVQRLGNAEPATAGGQSLVLVRITFGVGGSIGLHTHPGTLVASVESGTLGFTLRDDMAEMAVMRSQAAGTPVAEPMTPDQEVEVEAGDYFVETGMVHEARAIGNEPAVVLLSGLIEAGQPLTQCVEAPA